jgi:hypothetical protein
MPVQMYASSAKFKKDEVGCVFVYVRQKSHSCWQSKTLRKDDVEWIISMLSNAISFPTANAVISQ